MCVSLNIPASCCLAQMRPTLVEGGRDPTRIFPAMAASPDDKRDRGDGPAGLGIIDMFQEHAELADLFPNQKGQMLHAAISRTYIRRRTAGQGLHTDPIQYFVGGQSMERAISRHPLNRRDVDQSLEEMTQSLMARGLIDGVSSRTLLQETTHPQKFLSS